MIEWFDEVEIGNNTITVEVIAEWEEPDEELHPGYWDVMAITRDSNMDVTRLLDRQTLRRLERKAEQLAEASWDDAAVDFAIDVFCDWR